MSQAPSLVPYAKVVAGWIINGASVHAWASEVCPNKISLGIGVLYGGTMDAYPTLCFYLVSYPRRVVPRERKNGILLRTRQLENAPYTHEFQRTEEDDAMLQRDNLDSSFTTLLNNATFITFPDPKNSISLPGEVVANSDQLPEDSRKFYSRLGEFDEAGNFIKRKASELDDDLEFTEEDDALVNAEEPTEDNQ
ncbi:hypothetical protein DL93DRAFT_431474 [Clavulina sp. PMI_390]|nr:hypothetical protein DL93DRAFT_431474 [Clavulina sp. PMI_390]